jgi:hypothetical protein
MFELFKTLPIYIKSSKNKVDITNLETVESASKTAEEECSSIRNIGSDFNNANKTICSALRELGVRNSFWTRRLKILIQQLEGTEGGLSDIENRALRDLAEMTGGRSVYIVEHSNLLTISEAFSKFPR